MRIKNWSKFQHFKNRRPPWIKLHREILDQRDINEISDRSFRVLINLWLLASEDRELNGNLPSIEDIAFRTRISESDIINAIQELGSFVDHSDISVISERYQVGPPETETETEGETETETETPSRHIESKPNKISVPYIKIVDLYHQILPELPERKKLTEKRKSYLRARWHDGLPDLEHWEKFFTAIRGSRFLMGQTPASPGRNKAFIADLEWITNSTNYTKIYEGKYYE